LAVRLTDRTTRRSRTRSIAGRATARTTFRHPSFRDIHPLGRQLRDQSV
jgi:hypothetical protein